MSCDSARLRPQAVYDFEVEYLKNKGWRLTEYDWDIYVWNEPGEERADGDATQYDHDFALKMQAEKEANQ